MTDIYLKRYPAFIAIMAEMLYLQAKGVPTQPSLRGVKQRSNPCLIAAALASLAKTAAVQMLTILNSRITPAMPTPEENSKLVLAMYKHFHKKPDQVLFARDFQSYVVEKSLDVEDMKSGLAYGYEQKWFEDGPNGTIRLTQAGYDLLPPAA